MSSLIVSNLSDGTLSIPTTYVTNGSAKAWVNFNGTGTIAVRDSLNVSSLTDNGTGDYTVNIGSDFAAADYSVSVGGANAASADEALDIASPMAAGAFTLFNRDGAATKFDIPIVCANCHGDLA